MSRLVVMLAKDLRRAWRNPLPWLIFMAVPMLIVALIGSAFGPRASGEGGLGRIRFALVDEDESPLTSLLRGAANQAQGAKYLDPVVLSRAEAEGQLRDNQLSALLVIPRGFTRDYLTTTNPVTLDLVKNPAQSIHPAVIEELLGVVVTGLDVVKRHFGAELPAWQALFEGEGDYRHVADLIVRAGERFDAARQYLHPLRVGYVSGLPDAPDVSTGQANPEAPADDSGGGASAASAGSTAGPARRGGTSVGVPTAKPPGATFNLFGYLLPGMAAMFLLLLGNNAITDLKQEIRHGTLARTRTLHHQLLAFVGSKLVFAVVMLWICAAIILGGGSLVFRIHWTQPGVLVVLTAAYAVFAAGLMCLLGSLLAGEERADALSTVTAMVIGLAGGGAFPAEQLPGFIRDYVTPWLPNHWFTEAVQALSLGHPTITWPGTALLMFGLGAVLAVLAARVLQRRISQGRAG